MEPITIQWDPMKLHRIKCVEVLGEHDGALYHFLVERHLELHTVWSELLVILRSSEHESEALRQRIPRFCLLATNAMWRELIISIVAFNDYPHDEGRKCASLHALKKIQAPGDRGPLIEALSRLNEELTFLTQVRGNYIAHYQRKAQLQREFTKVEQERITRGLDAIEEVLTQFELLHKLPAAPRHHGPVEDGGAKSLLRMALQACVN